MREHHPVCIGMLAHVDAGKTTLSERILFASGSIRKMGRVDDKDTCLDHYEMERDRGITIFSKQAVFNLGEKPFVLLDTPGHVDFSAEMERTLQVLDYGVLIISGADGIQSHTETLWKLLCRYQIPTLIFVNKMDQPKAHKERLLEELKSRLDDRCVDFSVDQESLEFQENTAVLDERALDCYLEQGCLPREEIRRLIASRKVFPCYFGSALKETGTQAFIQGMEHYLQAPKYPEAFGAKVFKISRDSQGQRLTWLKVTGGTLKVKMSLSGEEKVNQIRIYSGARYETVPEAEAGTICVVTGPAGTRPGEGLGIEPASDLPVLEPVLTYELRLPDQTDPKQILGKLKLLEEEEPELHIRWDEKLKEIQAQIMGEVQIEVLKAMILDRFQLSVDFGEGKIVYKETITDRVEGVGHFEPLRHYAEVHLLLEPGEPGSGLVCLPACSEDQLDRNWQRLILTHLEEKVHKGVLMGAEVTDLKITLVSGKAHIKHTEGGDFRQATYRAVRQGLMTARSVLLEPWYDFRLELPPENLGRAMTDIQQMGGSFDAPRTEADRALLTGRAPVSEMGSYWQTVATSTRGRGRLSCALRGYEPCANQEEIVSRLAYDPERDVDNPPDSVFCSHGTGVTVKWNEVRDHMHVDSGLRLGEEAPRPEPAAPSGGERQYRGGSLEQDKELLAVFERTYGRVERETAFQPQKKPARTSLDEGKYSIKNQKSGPEYLLVDGYNIIFAWEELTALARVDVSAARAALEDILSDYQGFRKCVVILVFDAYKVKGNPGSVEKRGGIYVVYTKEAETADAYIEKATYDLGKNHRVRVATSDGLEQLIILGHGALRLSARSFKTEVEQARGEISALVDKLNRRNSELGKVKHTARIIQK